MDAVLSLGRRLARCERGATAIEYGLLAAFFVVAIVVGLANFGTAVAGLYETVDTSMTMAAQR